jgi:glycosyltransferase involved in cell wall biosynthesis
MALGKPVIATGWSGNLSFMDHRSGCLVRYKLVPVSGNLGFFRPEYIGPQARWADPLVEDAAQWMRRLHEDPGFRAQLGAAAKARIEQYQAEASGRGWIDQMIALWQSQGFLPRVAGKFSGAA